MPYALTNLDNGVTAAVGDWLAGSIANVGLVDLGDGERLVFDTFMSLTAARALRAEVGPATWVVNSHPHGDHYKGNAAWAEATIIASPTTRADLVAHAADRLEANRRHFTGILPQAEGIGAQAIQNLLAGLPTVAELRYPTVTFSSSLTLHGSARSVELRTLGAGHSLSDTILWLPEERILFSSDLVVAAQHPVLAEGDPEAWLGMLDAIDQLGPTTIVPGHGPVQGPEATGFVRQYLTDLLELSSRAIREGLTAEEIPLPEAYAGLPKPYLFTKNLTTLLNRRAVVPPYTPTASGD